MNDRPMRIALPVPAAGTAIGGAGEAYVASLVIQAAAFPADGSTHDISMNGNVLEELLMALRIRHLMFNPRTFAFNSNTIKAARLVDMIDTRWASVESFGPETIDLAERLKALAQNAQQVAFHQVN